MTKYQVIIIGGGPAGLTAGLYASRAGLKTLLIERTMFGGQIINAQKVENYPGFPDGISGFELTSLMHQQAVKYGLETMTAEVTNIKSGKLHQLVTTDSSFESNIIIVAAGAENHKLGVQGEEQFIGRGISYCATCDGFLFRDREVAVVGGGDTAITDALELAQHASKVYIIHRRDQLRAGQFIQNQAFAHPRIKFIWDTIVDEVIGETTVNALKLRNVKTYDFSTLLIGGVFVAIGIKPNSQIYSDIIDVDELGQIVIDKFMCTSVPGIYAAGDIRANSVRQVATAVGDGATAAMAAFKYINATN